MNTIKTSTYPNFKQAVWLLLVFLLIQIVFLIPLRIIEYMLNIDFGSNRFILQGIELAIFYLILHFGIKKTKAYHCQIIPFRPINLLLFFPIIVTILGMIFLTSKIDSLVDYLFPMPEFLEEFLYNAGSEDESVWEIFFCSALATSLIEELLFRGLILYGFLKNYSGKKAILFSAILFACMHFNPWIFFSSLFVGLLWAWWVIRTGSLWPSLFGHAFNNGIGIFIYHFDPNIIGIENDVQLWWFTASSLLLTVLGLWWFHQMTRYQKGESS